MALYRNAARFSVILSYSSAQTSSRVKGGEGFFPLTKLHRSKAEQLAFGAARTGISEQILCIDLLLLYMALRLTWHIQDAYCEP